MSTIIYHGSQPERTDVRKKYMPKSVGSKFPLIITSYEIALRDARYLSQYKWKYVVVDEVTLNLNLNHILLSFLFSLHTIFIVQLCFLFLSFSLFPPPLGSSIEKYELLIIEGIETPAYRK